MIEFALRAKAILRQAETQFSPLIEEAARARDFDSVRTLAALAARIQRVADDLGPEDRDAGPGLGGSLGEELVNSNATEPSTGGDFPQFRREGEALVKIAWSKAFGRTYEHRAERRVVNLITKILADLADKKGKRLRVQDLEKVAASDLVPSYQIYAVLSWLRWVGLIRQHGRQGYTVVSPSRFGDSVEAAWNQLKPTANEIIMEAKDGNTRS